MMETADTRNGHELSLGWRLIWSQYRTLFIERQVRFAPQSGLQKYPDFLSDQISIRFNRSFPQ
jgi:hypothetical protein